MGSTRQQWKRALKLVPRTGESAIAAFLAFASTEELWVIVPPMWEQLPEPLKEDYRCCCSSHAWLNVCYDRVPQSILPMLNLLLKRWRLVQPTKVANLLTMYRQFLLRRRWLLPQLEQARERGLAGEALLSLFDRLCVDYARGRYER